MGIAHAKVSTIPDGADTTVVRPSDWNADHVVDPGTITDVEVAAANKDGVAGTASMRTLGTGAQQAAAGDHAHVIVGGTTFVTGAADPSAGAGVAATRPAVYLRTTTDQLWLKTGAADTAWTLVVHTAAAASLASLITTGLITAGTGLKVSAGSAAGVVDGVYNPGGLIAIAVASTLRGFFDGNGFNGAALLSKLTVTAGPVAVTPVALADDSGGAGHIAVDATAGSSFKHTLTEATILDFPDDVVEGMQIQFTFRQAAAAQYAVTFAAGYDWGDELAPDTATMPFDTYMIISGYAISDSLIAMTQVRGFGA